MGVGLARVAAAGARPLPSHPLAAPYSLCFISVSSSPSLPLSLKRTYPIASSRHRGGRLEERGREKNREREGGRKGERAESTGFRSCGSFGSIRAMADVEFVALGPEGSYYVRFDDGDQSWRGLPTTLHNKLNSRNPKLPPVAFLALGPSGEWFVKFEDEKCYWENTPPDFGELILEKNLSLDIEYVSFGPNQTYFVRFTNGYAYTESLCQRHRDRFASYGRNNIVPEKLALGSNGDWWTLLDNKTIRYGTQDASLVADLHRATDVVFGCEGAYAVFDSKGLTWNVNDDFDEDIGYEETELVSYVSPDIIRYTQSTISYKFQNGFGSIFDLARDLGNGSVQPKDVPAIRVVKCNETEYWSLDNKRLWAFKLSGLTSIPVQFVPKGQKFDRKRKTAGDGWTVKVRWS